MRRALFVALALAIPCASCSPKPESSGTNTNWLRACASSEECVPGSDCVCGLCTRSCATDGECAPGVCGSPLATAFQCGVAESQPLCLPPRPDAGSCSEFVVAADLDLAATPTIPCDVPGALLCESFDAPLPVEDSSWLSGDVNVSVEDCLVHQGAGAIRYRTQTFGYAQTRMRLAHPVASGPLSARFYAYVPGQVVIPSYLDLFEFWSQDASSDGKISVEAKPGDALEVYLTPNGTTHVSSAGTLLRDQWLCIVLTLDVAASGGSMSLAVNGVQVLNQSGVITLPPAPISVAVIEALPSTDATAIDLVLDDLVVASEPLSCP